MPVSRSLWNYPEALWEACESAALRGEIKELPIASGKQGASVRARFYGFKKALKHEAAKLDLVQERYERDMATNPAAVKPLPLRDARNIRLRELARRIDTVSCWLDTEGLRVQIMPTDLSPIGLQFAGFRTVGVADLPPQQQAAVDEMGKKLLEVQAEVDKLKPKTERDYG